MNENPTLSELKIFIATGALSPLNDLFTKRGNCNTHTHTQTHTPRERERERERDVLPILTASLALKV